MRYVAIMLAVLATVTFTACGGGRPATQRAPAEPSAAPSAATVPSGDIQTVEVTMSEFKFELTPMEVRAGKVRFELKNVGAVEHSFVIEGAEAGSGQIRPGLAGVLEADLAPGTYTVICDVAGHKEAGMTMELVVK